MAKPLSSSSPECPPPSLPASCSAWADQGPSYHSRHRRRRKPKSSQSVAPSSGLLVLLASVASASTAGGSPAPPVFLCPSINANGLCGPTPAVSSSSAAATITPSPPDSSTFLATSGRHLPDQFRPDSNGMWRRVPTYTLFGSTVTVNCDSPTHSPAPSSESVQEGVVKSPANSTSTTSTYDIRDSLPPGWKPSDKPYQSRTPLILSLSLVLALFICFFIVGCLFWRSNTKKKRSKDIEAKARRLPGENDTRDLIEKEVKSRQKVWARATARWRANVRHSARRRRGARLGSRLSTGHQSNLSIDRPRSQRADSMSMRSHASSRRSSVVSLAEETHGESVVPTSPSPSQNRSLEVVPAPPASPSLPPAYQQERQSSRPHFPLNNASSELQLSNLILRPSHTSPLSITPSVSGSINVLHSDLPELVSLNAAHVATDDKALLARLADLASSPPPDASGSTSMPGVEVSAPAWDDDDVGDLGSDFMIAGSHPSDTSESTPGTMFPQPPSKERLAAAERYMYPFSIDDLDTLEVDAGPSAPPFQEDSSPPLPDSHMLPSAPPLSEADEFPQGILQASAPDWDSMTEHASPTEEPSGQDHDRIRTESTPIGPPSFPAPPTPISTSTADSIALPGYRP
ncbi:hypothetical protein CVT26_009301 [Gymnopilus dilepis]|uniref:Uncharacterized protein n=1 Tax=Gymnopilus dilepis TaxID=231916 RepID=A0A409YAB3_9AGAR|nr:hypothetical protein CVT26_009301 [Gymnopilus dilepis]